MTHDNGNEGKLKAEGLCIRGITLMLVMMDNWRTKGNQEFGRSKSYYHKRKPPAGGNSNGPNNISSWEKRFVTSSMSWKQFLEAKKYTHLSIYNNISNWDDSAGEEAFKTAKDAFYAKLHGIPYEVKSHDPDFYNNKIEWNSQEDNDLIRNFESDFESEVVVQDINNNHEPVVIFGDALPDPSKNYAPYGWGDADDKVKGTWGVSDEINKVDGNVINWDYIKDGKIIWADTNAGCKNNDWWDRTDNNAGDQGWNDTHDNAGDQGWNYNVNRNNYVDDYNNNYYPSYGNNNNNYYPSYGNVNNERYGAYNFTGNNSQRNRTWRNSGIKSKSSGQGYGRQRAHGSTMQAHGGQGIHVHQ
ncbi:hypothetical protein Tco_0545575 [Tanacetum coccineum]